MNRALVFLAASAAAALAVTSACLANTKAERDFRAENIYFTMTPAERGGVELSLSIGRHHNMSSRFAAAELAGSQVIFELAEKNTSARGTLQTDGTFQLTTNAPDDGAFPGEHQVIIIEPPRPMLGGSDSSEIAPGLLDPKYADPGSSGLTATVEPKRNEITLTVERNPKR